MLADVYEAHSILSKNALLDFFFEFFKDLVDNEPIYGIQFQRKINESLSTLQNKERLTQKKKQKKNACAGIYVFAICVDYNQNIRVFNSHPTPTKLGRNGTGVRSNH